MKKAFLTLAVLSVILQGCGLFGSGGTGRAGELTGVQQRMEWDQYQPMGMVYIPPGSFHMGQNDQDVPYSQISHNRQITISAYFMDETEVTNNEYRQFVFGPSSEETNAYQESGAIDTIDPRYADIIIPDTTVWIRDFAYSYNEPLMENYFWHPAFDDYPVVGVNWYAAQAFCQWRTAHLNNFREERGEAAMPRFRLPTEAEWEYGARGGYEHKLYPWEGPYLRNSKGCFLANFKPGRGDYIADNFEYTAPANSYIPNDYGLYNMPGNVAEWCEDDFEEAGYTYSHDLNPRYLDPRFKLDDREPGGAKIRKVIRGGSWKDIGYFLSCGTRSYEYADTAKSFIGFRCVATVIGRSGAAGGF
ncbi:SUMF1/EgtB/PvdO family nonheme iron enzyme [Pontibacter sp. G13]|uniref:type IX secretion system lipoprotein PorK/GldK n=1 Tax=Pontibacter sp. G13 TaxID=3074898 RepID=UPI002889FB94|nr:SUMF1/EgtB/PvdO family nonheme iron enzyme [Pontibacter sp. G13]WNJ16241.1 SUMF1/EgtB/PvdO family nonheme iron enzyme [Pontibacter sp. G13]